MKLAHLARLISVELAGDGDVEIDSIVDSAHARPGAVVFVSDPRRVPEADASAAGALLVGADAPRTAKPALRAANPRAAFARVLAAFFPAQPHEGIHPTAVVAPDARIAGDVTLGPQVVIGPGAQIGAETRILAGTVIGAGARIGCGCLLHANVTIYPSSVLGDHVIVHSGAVIGSDGFGYAVEGNVHVKIPHVGRVVLEDDVEIGANTTVDRGTLGETRIGRGSKIDNLVQIAHNVTIGAGSLIVSQSGIAGSSRLGAGVILAAAAGVTDHVTIGDGVRVLGRAGVTKDVPPGAIVWGTPAQDHREELRMLAAMRRLPEMLKRLAALEAVLADRGLLPPRPPQKK